MQGGDRVRRMVRVAVSLAIAAYILANEVTVSELAAIVSRARPGLLALAVAIYLAGQMLSSLKWRMLGRSVGFERSAADYGRFYFIGMFFNLFGPSTLGGDFVRGLYLADGRRPTMALSSVLFDRMTGLVVLMALGSAALVLFPRYRFPWPVTAAVVAGGLALVIGWWMLPALVRLLPPHHRVRRRVEHDLAPFWRDRALLSGVALVSLVFHLSQVGLQFVLAQAVGVAIPLAYCLVFHPLMAALTALPISVGGLGIREGGYLFFFSRVGASDVGAVAVGVTWWLVSLVGGLAGGLVFLASGARLPRLRMRHDDRPERRGDEPYGVDVRASASVREIATPSLPPA
jgi:uncharacterized membrane protein YbhN (UPF0104 family)